MLEARSSGDEDSAVLDKLDSGRYHSAAFGRLLDVGLRAGDRQIGERQEDYRYHAFPRRPADRSLAHRQGLEIGGWGF